MCVQRGRAVDIFLNDFYELPCVDINGRWGLYNTIYITYEIPNLSLDFQMISRYVLENFLKLNLFFFSNIQKKGDCNTPTDNDVKNKSHEYIMTRVIN